MRLFVEVAVALGLMQAGEPDDLRVVPGARRWDGRGFRFLGSGEQDTNADHGAIGGITVETEGVKCVGESGTQVETIEDLAEVQVAGQGVGKGAEEAPGNDRGPDDDGGSLRAVAGQDRAGV